MSRICTRCQQAVPDGDLLCGCQVVNDPSADVIARLTAIAEGEEDAGYGFDPLSQVIVNVTDLRALLTAALRGGAKG